MEFMSQYDAKIMYVHGEDNSVADALSWLPAMAINTAEETMFTAKNTYAHCAEDEDDVVVASILDSSDSPLCGAEGLANRVRSKVCTTLSITTDKILLDEIKKGYEEDCWIQDTLSKAKAGMPGTTLTNGLWYVGSRLIVPQVGHIRETLFRLVHDVLGHFGFDKTYGMLQDSYYWLNMRHDLEAAYVPGCVECQRNKSATSKLSGPLHPLPVPEEHGDSVVMDFIGPLPQDGDFDMILTFTDRLGADV
jgi:hypothetical protein